MSDANPAGAEGNAEYLGSPSKSDTHSAKSGRKWIAPAIAAVGGLLVGVVGTLSIQGLFGGGTDNAEEDLRLSKAYSSCGSPTGTTLADENRTLTIDVRGKEDSTGASYDDQACILGELAAPTSVKSHLQQTTAMDGRQSESWDGTTAEWSYHPDRGSDMVITLD